MARLWFYLNLSLIITVFIISNCNCSNETSASSQNGESNISSTSNSSDDNTTFNKHSSAEMVNLVDKDIGNTKPFEVSETTTASPNLEIQSSSTSVVRPVEATTPVPRIESYATENYNSDSKHHEHIDKEKNDEKVVMESQVISSKDISQHEMVMTEPRLSIATPPEPIVKFQNDYLNATIAPIIKVPIPIVIENDFQSSETGQDLNASSNNVTTTR